MHPIDTLRAALDTACRVLCHRGGPVDDLDVKAAVVLKDALAAFRQADAPDSIRGWASDQADEMGVAVLLTCIAIAGRFHARGRPARGMLARSAACTARERLLHVHVRIASGDTGEAWQRERAYLERRWEAWCALVRRLDGVGMRAAA